MISPTCLRALCFCSFPFSSFALEFSGTRSLSRFLIAFSIVQTVETSALHREYEFYQFAAQPLVPCQINTSLAAIPASPNSSSDHEQPSHFGRGLVGVTAFPLLTPLSPAASYSKCNVRSKNATTVRRERTSCFPAIIFAATIVSSHFAFCILRCLFSFFRVPFSSFESDNRLLSSDLSTLHSTMAFSDLSAIVIGLGTLYFILYRLQLRRSRPDEPPVIPAPGLPFLGHVLCMVLQGGRYMQQLGLQIQHMAQGGVGTALGGPTPSKLSSPSSSSSTSSTLAGIVTLPVPGSRIYLVTDPSLAVAVQRASRALSFTPLVPDVTRRVLGLDEKTVGIVRGENLAVATSPRPKPAATSSTGPTMSIVDDQKYDESYGFLADMHDMVYSYLGPGDKLTTFVKDAVSELVDQVITYASGLEATATSAPPVVDLLAWMKHFVTLGTAQFLYGPRNPLAVQPELEPAFWDFVHGLGRLLLVGDRRPGSLMASLLGGRPFAARERLVDGFTAYLTANEHLSNDSSEIVRRRVAIADRYGWTRSSTARSELSFLFAGIINTAVTSFWVVLRLFSEPELLRTVRQELEQDVADSDNNNSGILSIDHIRTGCPTLNAVYQECLRLGSNNMSTRLVLSDTMLADRYFLRAGSVVQIAAGVIHADPSLWGPDVDTFDPTRFMPKTTVKVDKTAERTTPTAPKRHPAAFRAFGGGKTLCPGRHFATAEILSFAAAVVLTFDAEDAAASAKGQQGVPPKVPPRNDRVLPIHILEPAAKDVPQIRLRLRRPGQALRVVP